jgi:hypothetical protein
MRHSLLGDAAVGLVAGRGPLSAIAVAAVLSGHSMALATTWTISGASAGGVSQSVTSLASGSIAINVNASGFTPSTVNDPGTGVRSALWTALDSSGPLSSGELGFFGFTDSGGSGATYFGVAWSWNLSPASLSFTSSNTNQQGVLTNIAGATTTGVSSFTPTTSGPPTPDSGFYYFLYANVTDPSTISISGTIANQTVRWLDWNGSSWTSVASGSTGAGGAFALGNAVVASAIPGGAAPLVGGLAAGLLRRRRQRQSV